ncbi:MAG: carboxylesterase/lipase family protein [Bdellovibrionota bacterium]
MKIAYLPVLLLTLAPISQAANGDDTVKTRQGIVHGSSFEGTVSFKGIPFAQPPLGELRWTAPQPIKGWSGVQEAADYGSPCLQTENMDADAKVIGSEDCLSLNVWKPAKIDKPLPVMVFIYGGAFAWGSSSGHTNGIDLYDGTYLSSHGPAVVVTFNYRVGALGFLTHPALAKDGTSGNYGLMDQIAALHWVQENIAQFGGDASRVMIFGESAGAFSVLGLITSPQAKGLFSRALLESGSDIRDTAARAEKIGSDFVTSANCDRTADFAACLRALDKNEVMRVSSLYLHGQGAKLIYAPHVDGKLIPDFPLRALRNGNYHHVPLIVGTNADEMTVLGIPIIKEKPFFNRQDYEAGLKQEFGEELGEKVIAEYGSPSTLTPFGLLREVFADNVFHCPAHEIAATMSAKQPGQVWRYVFAHSFHLDFTRILGAGHALELPYVFHNFVPWYSIQAPNWEEIALSEKMVSYWTRFAATGNPNGDGDFAWPAYSSETKYLELESPLTVKDSYRSKICDFWRKNSLTGF